jgi:hypothetical protein
MVERTGLLLPLDETFTPADAEVHASFVEAHDGMREAYRQLTVPEQTRADMETAFREGRISNPDLTAQHLDEKILKGQAERLLRWRDGLGAIALDQDIREAYEARASESIANVRMLLASNRRDMAGVREQNEFIYGRPDAQTYRAALDWFGAQADRYTDHENPAVADAAQRVVDTIRGQRGDRTLLVPDRAVFEAVRTDHYREGGYYALLLAGVTIPEGVIRPEAGNPIVEHVVRNNLQSDYVLRAGSGAWGVVHSEAAVEHPAKYALPKARFIGLPLGHEVGSHLLEGVNGQRGPIALAGPGPASGLDRYELGNEGRAVIREQVVYERFEDFEELIRWRDILRRYVAIGYGDGTETDVPHTFADTYAFINAIDTMYAGLKETDPIAIADKAHARTWSLLARVLKGTDGTGGAYAKDLVYLDGHVRNWRTAAKYGPGVISEGDLGKFDITNPRHVTLLQGRGLLKPRMEVRNV